jgi:hypothetical protein
VKRSIAMGLALHYRGWRAPLAIDIEFWVGSF